jgi:hypothetical protein
MWFTAALDKYDTAEHLISTAMIKMAASVDELWGSLKATGISNQLGINNKQQLEQYMAQKDPSFLSSMGQQSSQLAQPQQQQVQTAYSNYLAGHVLGEEISKARQQAISEGRQPSVAELRAARQRANQRIQTEDVWHEGLGMPKQIQVGRRGPLSKVRVQEWKPPIEKIKDETLISMANSILEQELQKARGVAFQEYVNGQRETADPTTAEIRAAMLVANQKLQEGLKFQIGKRGPVPKTPGLTRNIENNKEYYEWKKKREKKENLGLSDILDVAQGDVPVATPNVSPGDNYIPEEDMVEQQDEALFKKDLDIINKQYNFRPLPPLHPPTCRCRIVPLGKTFKWQTAGDERVCEQCKFYEAQFNALNQI